MANEEMAQFLGVFLDEASEQLELLEQDILKLEHESTPELLQEIFRAAHTLKGSSRAMGFTALGELTHAMEDVFDRLRSNTLTVDSRIVDTLFETLDLLKAMKEEIAATGESRTDTADLTARLRAILSGGAGERESGGAGKPDDRGLRIADCGPKDADLTASVRMAMDEARRAGCKIYRLNVRVADDCVMKSVRALMVLQSLETIGSILSTTPDEEAIENEAFDLEVGVVIAAECPVEKIEQCVKGTTEIAGVEIRELTESPTAGTANPQSAIRSPQSSQSDEEPVAVVQEQRRADLGPEARGKGGEAAGSHSTTVRVDVARLDNLLNLVGELVIDQTRIAQLAARIEQHRGGDETVDFLIEAAAHFGRITGEMQNEIMKARMLPVDSVFNRFPRMIRDLAQKLGKEIDFVVTGRETELDRSVIEVIGDPLIHLLRNSLDHGIELPDEREAVGKNRQGTVWLRARHEENHIVIEIEDDGRGIDPDKLRAAAVKKGVLSEEAAGRLTDKEAMGLIFASGFSTATVVSDVSGRGVGMDIVKNNLTRFGALLDMDSKIGAGTTFTIKLPLTLAIIRGLLVNVESGVYAAPLASVVETVKVEAAQVHLVNGQEIMVQRGATIPLIRLRNVLYGTDYDRTERGADGSLDDSLYVVVVGVAERQVGLVVDGLLGEQEIVIKSLGKFIGDVRGVSGATILGDGRIALILDVNGLIAIATEEKVHAHAA